MSIHVSRNRYYCVLAFILVALSLVGVTGAWQVRSAVASADDTGTGDLVRQVTYIGLALAATAPMFPGVLTRVIRSVPVSLWILLAWCCVTLAWSPVPDIGFRRLVVTVLIAFSCLLVMRQLRPEVALYLIWKVLMLLLGLSVATVVVAPELGIHQQGDPEISVVGAWRGIFYHKNILGAVSAFALLLSTYRTWSVVSSRASRARRSGAYTGFALSLLVLLMSGSKTSAALAIALCGLFLFLSAARRRTGRLLFALAGLAVLLPALAATAVLASGYNVEGRIRDPELFTGRGFIWGILLDLAKQHPLGGIGFQSVFQVGSASALSGQTDAIFYDTLAHAHNAYIELLVSIGAVGLTIAIVALVIAPMRSIVRLDGSLYGVKALLIATFVFVFMHAFLESGLLDRDRPGWIMFLLCYGVCLSANSGQRSQVRAGRLGDMGNGVRGDMRSGLFEHRRACADTRVVAVSMT